MSESAPQRHLRIVPNMEIVTEQLSAQEEQEKLHNEHNTLSRRVIGAAARINMLGHSLSAEQISDIHINTFIQAWHDFNLLSDSLIESSRTLLGDTPSSGPTAS